MAHRFGGVVCVCVCVGGSYVCVCACVRPWGCLSVEVFTRQLPERYAQLVHQIEPLLERRSFGSSNLDFQSSLTLYVRLAERRHADA